MVVVVLVSLLFYLQSLTKILRLTTNFYRKVAFLMYTGMVKFRLKAGKPLKNENHTEDWALGSHPHDNGHVTH